MTDLTDIERREYANQILENPFWRELMQTTRVQCIGGWLSTTDPEIWKQEWQTIQTLESQNRALRVAAGLEEEEDRPAINE